MRGRCGSTGEETKKTGVEGALERKRGDGASLPISRKRARVRWMNVIEGCPVEFARALVLYLAACNRRDFYQDEKCALISVTLAVARLLNGSFVRDRDGNCRWQATVSI